MFLFRKNAEPADEAGDHEPIDVSNAAHEPDQPQEEEEDAPQHHEEEEEEAAQQYEDEEHQEEAEEEHEVHAPAEEDPEHEDAYAQEGHHAEEEEDEEDDHQHTPREGTVPPLDHDHLAEEAVEVRAEAPAHAGNVPALTMPRTASASAGAAAPSPSNQVLRRGSRGTTPRATAGLSPRSNSRAGQSYAFSALSAEDAEVREQHYRRCSSTVRSARNIAERRASSVNYTIGSIGGGAARRGSGSMTAAEREAVERMMENEWHRQETAERSAQFELIRENAAVENELEKEKAHYTLLQEREKERQAEIGRRSSLRAQRMTTAAQRRAEAEKQRQEAILASVSEKETRYHMRDPYTVVAAQRRYRSPVVAARRTSSPFQNGGGVGSRRTSGAVNENNNNHHHNGGDQRRYSAPVTTPRNVKPGIDMSRPRQCLPMDAWKTPEQLQRKARAGSTPHVCLPPGAWKASTVADHPRQWH